MGDVAVKKCGEIHCGLIGGQFSFIAAAGLIHCHHCVGPAQQVIAAICWHTQQGCNHMYGQGARECIEKIEGVIWKGINEPMAGGGDFWCHGGDFATREGPQN